jgi:hypothetical protein
VQRCQLKNIQFISNSNSSFDLQPSNNMILLNVFLKVFLYADNIPILSYIDFVQDFVSLIDINTFGGK